MGIQTHRIIRKKIIKKIVVIDGKPVEIEEVVNEPSVTTDDVEPQESQTGEAVHIHNVIKKRIIRKIKIVDGKPIEVEEFEEDPISVGSEPQHLVTEEGATIIENERKGKIELTEVTKSIETPTDMKIKLK